MGANLARGGGRLSGSTATEGLVSTAAAGPPSVPLVWAVSGVVSSCDVINSYHLRIIVRGRARPCRGPVLRVAFHVARDISWQTASNDGAPCDTADRACLSRFSAPPRVFQIRLILVCRVFVACNEYLDSCTPCMSRFLRHCNRITAPGHVCKEGRRCPPFLCDDSVHVTTDNADDDS